MTGRTQTNHSRTSASSRGKRRRNRAARETRPLGTQSTRAVAATVLAQVLGHGRSLTAALDSTSALTMFDERDRALATEFCYGVMRWHTRLRHVLDRMLSKPLRSRDADVEALVLVGLYQLEYMRVPAHAAVSETVAATAALDKSWARGLVNASLRRFDRERQPLLEDIDRADDARLAHPQWLLTALQRAWPQHWSDIAVANNARAPMHLRVNHRHHERASYLQLLRAQGIGALALTCEENDASQPGSDGIALTHPVAVRELPGFGRGDVSVQDGAAQLAAHLIELEPGLRVLDACAAPGGKTAHLLEREDGLEALDALDASMERLVNVRETLARHGIALSGDRGRTQSGTAISLRCADAGEPQTWWDGQPYDRILLDAPCTATGVIRRHPDIKYLRRYTDVAASAARQSRLLERLWPLLATGGRLLYATCSVLPAENEATIEHFIDTHADAIPCWAGDRVREDESRHASFGLPLHYGRQLLPGSSIEREPAGGLAGLRNAARGPASRSVESAVSAQPNASKGVDGFYYALLGKA